MAGEVSTYWTNLPGSGIQTAPACQPGPPSPCTSGQVVSLGDPIHVGGVANIKGLTVFDSVYTAVRGKAFAAR